MSVASGIRKAAAQIVVPTMLAVAAANPLAAQTLASNDTGRGLPRLEDAGTAAADLCKRKGDHGPDCVRQERNKLVAAIEAAARADADRARADADRARQVTAGVEQRKPCIEKLKLASDGDKEIAMKAAGAEQITRDNVCSVAERLP